MATGDTRSVARPPCCVDRHATGVVDATAEPGAIHDDVRMEPFIAEIRILSFSFATSIAPDQSRSRGDTTLGDVVVVREMDKSSI